MTSIDIGAPVDAKFDIGRVITRTFTTIGRNWLVFLILAVILAALPTLVLGLIQQQIVHEAMSQAFNPAKIGFSLLAGLLRMLCSSVLQAAVVFAAVRDLSGSKASFGESLSVGLRNALPVIGLNILFGLALGVGFVLLFVPGLILLCMWAVITPALVVDRTGVFGAFERSQFLTKNHRWAIFGLIVIVWLISLAISMIVMPLVGVSFMATAQTGIEPIGAVLVASPILSIVSTLLTASGVASLYVELRHVKEGALPQTLAAVFD